MHHLLGRAAFLSQWAQATCSVAWFIILVCALDATMEVWRTRRSDLLTACGLAAVALAIRLALPWGPINFVDAERLGPLWEKESFLDPVFAATPSAFAILRELGFSPDTLMRFWGPLFGGLGTLAAYACVRTAGAGRAAASLAGVIVATWPGHVHYSTGPMLSVEAGALGVAALTVATGGFRFATIPLLASLTTLAVHTRPECRLLVVPVLLLVLRREWSWRRRWILAGALVAGLSDYVVPALTSAADLGGRVPECAERFFRTIVGNPLVFGLLWFGLAAAGVLFGRGGWRVRLALGFMLVGLAIAYWFQGSDPSPQWGQWRYWSSTVPYVAVTAALFVARFESRSFYRPLVAVAAVLAIAALPRAWQTLRTPNNEQATYAFVRDTAPGVVGPTTSAFILPSVDAGTPQSSALLGLGAAFGGFEGIRWRCHDALPPDPVIRLSVLDAAGLQCPGWVPREGGVLFLGIERPDALLTQIEAKYTLEPLREQTVRVVADMPRINPHGICSGAWGLIGPTYDAHFGWYRLKPRT